MLPMQLHGAVKAAARLALIKPRHRRSRVTSRDISSRNGNGVDSHHSDGSGVDAAKLLEHPTWSVASLLSEKKPAMAEETETITPAQLRHLLRLSALPYPSSADEQAAKLATLRTQLQFVRDIQSVDTSGLQPLQSIRDETREGLKEQTIGVKTVEQTLLQEESFGHNSRPRRRKRSVDTFGVENWDVLETAARKAGRHIVVNGAEQ